MKKFKKVMAMGLATMAAVSAMSVSAFAEDIPMHSEVNTTLATPENPVTYIDETTGAKVTIYDPTIEVVFTDISMCSVPVLSGNIFVPMGSLTSKGEPTETFIAPSSGTAEFTLYDLPNEYNVSLNMITNAGNSTLAVTENCSPKIGVKFKNITKDKEYFFRLSSWVDDGEASYEVEM